MNLFCRRLYIVALGLLWPLIPSLGQPQTFRQLEEKVYQLNNALKYNESQTLLLPVLQSDAFSADEKYQAALLLSYTYKRVGDYPATLQFLAMARQFARQTPKQKPYLATILGQEAFAYFDSNQYQRADSLMATLAKTGFRYIDLENKAKLVMQQGYLLFLAKHYPEAEATYNQAIGWLRASSPCDLPMIYVKKMQLYAAMNRMDLLQNALAQSRMCADSCAIIKYHIYAYDELLTIYKKRNDMAGIVATTHLLDSMNMVYARSEKIAALHSQKEGLLLGDKDRKLQQEHAYGTHLTVGLWGVALLALALLVGMLMYRHRQRTMDRELARMNRELARYAAVSRSVPPGKALVNEEAHNALTGRQRAVMACLAAGLSNKEIADKLFVSENTVKYHIKNIYQSLDIKDRKALLNNFAK